MAECRICFDTTNTPESPLLKDVCSCRGTQASDHQNDHKIDNEIVMWLIDSAIAALGPPTLPRILAHYQLAPRGRRWSTAMPYLQGLTSLIYCGLALRISICVGPVPCHASMVIMTCCLMPVGFLSFLSTQLTLWAGTTFRTPEQLTPQNICDEVSMIC